MAASGNANLRSGLGGPFTQANRGPSASSTDDIGGRYFVRDAGRLKHAAQTKEPSGMSRVSNASANEQGSKRRSYEQPGRAVSGQFAHAGSVEHFPHLIKGDRVQALTDEGWESRQSVQVSRVEEIILIASYLVLAVCAQSGRRPSEKVLRNAGAVIANG